MAGHTSYFEDAERMLRNHLLASQMDDLSWVTENQGIANTETRAYEGLQGRAYGAFCFGDPNGFHSYNSDLTGAALQGIAAAWEHIITDAEDGGIHINLLLSREHDAVDITSLLPESSTVVVESKRPIDLSIRIPPWCEREVVEASINGTTVPITIADDYLNIGELSERARVEVTFVQPQFLTQERAIGHDIPYRIRWLGNTVIAMSGAGSPYSIVPRTGKGNIMKITEIEVHQITLEYVDWIAYQLNHYYGPTRRTIYVVHTDNGLVGLGEGGGTEPQEVIDQYIGTNPFEWIGDETSLALGTAMYDLMGKAAGVPVYKLFGQKYRSWVPVGSWTVSTHPKRMAEAVEQYAAQGYTWLKYHLSPFENVIDQTEAMQAVAPEGFKIHYDLTMGGTDDHLFALCETAGTVPYRWLF